MSSLMRRMQKNSGDIGTSKIGKYVGLRHPDCKCCVAKSLRDAKRLAKSTKKGGHVL